MPFPPARVSFDQCSGFLALVLVKSFYISSSLGILRHVDVQNAVYICFRSVLLLILPSAVCYSRTSYRCQAK